MGGEKRGVRSRCLRWRLEDSYHMIVNIGKIVFKRCLVNVGAALISILCIFILAVGAVRICLWLSFPSEQTRMLESCVPVLEKLIWPLFILFLIFLFKNSLEKIVRELPSMIRRSSFPHSQLVGQPLISDSQGKGIVDVANGHTTTESFDQGKHDKNVETLLSILEDEIDCRIKRNVRVNNTTVTANGAVVFAGRLWYVAILPESLQGRIVDIILRMQNLLGESVKHNNQVLMICVYGKKQRMTRKALSELRNETAFPVVIRFFDETAMN